MRQLHQCNIWGQNCFQGKVQRQCNRTSPPAVGRQQFPLEEFAASSPTERDHSRVSPSACRRPRIYLRDSKYFPRLFTVQVWEEGGFPSARHCKFSRIRALFIIPFEIIYIFLLLLLLNATALPICVKGLALSTGRAGIEGSQLPNEVSHPAAS